MDFLRRIGLARALRTRRARREFAESSPGANNPCGEPTIWHLERAMCCGNLTGTIGGLSERHIRRLTRASISPVTAYRNLLTIQPLRVPYAPLHNTSRSALPRGVIPEYQERKNTVRLGVRPGSPPICPSVSGAFDRPRYTAQKSMKNPWSVHQRSTK